MRVTRCALFKKRGHFTIQGGSYRTTPTSMAARLTPASVDAALRAKEAAEFKQYYDTAIAPAVLQDASEFYRMGNGLLTAIYARKAVPPDGSYRERIEQQLRADYPEWTIDVKYNEYEHDPHAEPMYQIVVRGKQP
mgnify:FL=1